MGDESAVVSRVPGLIPQMHFQNGERTDNAEPRLDNDQRDSGQVRGAKPWIADPFPPAKAAAKNDQQPADDEHDKRDVGDQHPVGEHAASFSGHQACDRSGRIVGIEGTPRIFAPGANDENDFHSKEQGLLCLV